MINKTIKPILFNTEDVKAILDGKKNKTTRVAKLATVDCPNCEEYLVPYGWVNGMEVGYQCIDEDCMHITSIKQVAKYEIGDILYIREKSYFVDCDCQSPWQCSPQGWYATDEVSYSDIRCSVKTIPSIHMRKEHARVFLKVTNVKFERLQDIGNKDLKFVFVHEFEKVEKIL